MDRQQVGHPWDTVDEFFASAHGAYQQKPLFEKIVAHYGKADKKIPPLAKKLFALLAKVGDPKALAALKTPANNNSNQCRVAKGSTDTGSR